MNKFKQFMKEKGAMLAFAMLVFSGGVMMTSNTTLAADSSMVAQTMEVKSVTVDNPTITYGENNVAVKKDANKSGAVILVDNKKNNTSTSSTLESSSLYTNAKKIAEDVYKAVASISTYVAIAMAAICLLIGQFSTDPQRIKQFRGIAIGIGVTWVIIMMLGWIFSAIYPYISSGTTFTTS